MNIATTSDLKALRLLLGLSPSEAAAMIGESKDWLVDAERGRNWHISPKYRDALLVLEHDVQGFIAWVAGTDARFVIAYPNDEVFRSYDPLWAASLPSSLVHLQACARAVVELPDRVLNIVTLAPRSFEEYLAKTEKLDAPETRQEWAQAYSKNYRLMDPTA